MEKGTEEKTHFEKTSIIFRVWRHFEIWIKKGGLIGGTSSDYLLPSECCVMVNVILDCKVQVIDCELVGN